MNPIEIELRELSNNIFHASIQGDQRCTTQSGNTAEEAVGKLIIAYTNTFGVVIKKS